MKTISSFFSVLFFVFVVGLFGQSTNLFVYDQQSANESTGGGGASAIQTFSPIGQSFTPTFDSVGFIRLNLSDAEINGLGATVVVNLRSNSITGPILGTATPVTMPDGFIGYPNFTFSNVVPVVPNTQYFFDVAVQSGDLWAVTSYNYGYTGGVSYANGAPFPASDLWFREGIIGTVPEPSSVCLGLAGAGALGWFLRRRSSSSG
ncbi:MAG: PEP-CTERM sorting domain-containing protein [Verrucomicrobia bacterium]|nr:PEP-CTERM sorting domain-containing protein [Verrucomicrobiota bacterium]